MVSLIEERRYLWNSSGKNNFVEDICSYCICISETFYNLMYCILQFSAKLKNIATVSLKHKNNLYLRNFFLYSKYDCWKWIKAFDLCMRKFNYNQYFKPVMSFAIHRLLLLSFLIKIDIHISRKRRIVQYRCLTDKEC